MRFSILAGYAAVGPGGKAQQTYANPLFGQPYGFAFDSDVTGK